MNNGQKRPGGNISSGEPVQAQARLLSFDYLNRMLRRRQVQTMITLGLVTLGPVLAFATYLVLGPLATTGSAPSLRLVILADLVYVLVLATLVLYRVAQMIAARRAHSAGSRLHLRLTGVFAAIALIPTITVAIFAGLTINVGLEGWFSDRVRTVVGASLAAAEAYEEEHRRDLTEDARVLASSLDRARTRIPLIGDGEMRELLTQGQTAIQRGLREAYVVDGAGEIRARGERSYLFDFEAPTPEQIEIARAEGVLIIQDWDNNEFRALVPLEAYLDRLLYVSRNVDGEILNLLDDTQETVVLYQQLEQERGRLVFEFGLLYLAFAVILILAAIWLGLWFAERLSRPVGRLTGAAQRVGAGDLDVRVREDAGDDEIAMLGRIFNQMTRQLKGQREALLDNNRQIEDRRRLFDSVLSSVTAGVVGLDQDGAVTFVNRSATRLLDVDETNDATHAIEVAVPEFADLFAQLKTSANEVAQEEIKVVRRGRQERLLVRMATRRNRDGGLDGYVVAFDDVTDLVSAQRMAAWGDVARRIAHEIKNPLTPIQLSAERIQRKFAAQSPESAEAVSQYTDVIIRQTEDLLRIVNEFSKFARMPEPERKPEDLVPLVRDAITLRSLALPEGTVHAQVPEGQIMADVDSGMISQALGNLIKNAGEAIETHIEKTTDTSGFVPRILVELAVADGVAQILVSDNGVGLPHDRAQLFEPYVTTRDQGTGLGLPIVKKIIEDHGGTLDLIDAEPFDDNTHKGACARIRLPITEQEKSTKGPELDQMAV